MTNRTNVLSLRDAIETNRLEDFIRQQEEGGVCSAQGSDFERLSEKLIKFEKSEDQT
jgi:hypothetical protein